MMRLPVDARMMKAARLASESSTCLRRKCGCVAARGNQLLLMGFNGAPTKEKHCDEVGCTRKGSKPGHDLNKCRALHAEAGLITIAARYGIALDGTTFYVTHRPCKGCWKLIVNAGVVRVVYGKEYPDPYATEVPGRVEVVRYVAPRDTEPMVKETR